MQSFLQSLRMLRKVSSQTVTLEMVSVMMNFHTQWMDRVVPNFIAVAMKSMRNRMAARVGKKGDVIGCIYDLESKSLKYMWNGKDMGVAFTIESTPMLLCPAFSLNENEIVKVNIGPSFAYGANEWIGVNDLVQEQSIEEVKDEFDMEDSCSSNVSSSPNQNEMKDKTSTVEKKIVPTALYEKTTPKHFDLSTIHSVDELEELGMDELKAILFSIGLKCGGTLKERAERLFSVKGLQVDDIPEKLRGKNFSAVRK